MPVVTPHGRRGDYSRAVIDFSWLVMAQPWSWRAHIALAGTWMMLKEYTTAIISMDMP
ncbi:type III secretion system chaperone protein SscB [Salmonella enterica subsp. enterica]|uniref:Type III secretion system chaperone protein SscB n=1 Tax=Salmonella enterica I TaxID=59201 RepID=A0A379UPK6_SALET|nr:type III secretion system chaperone protein SscB [Salmonella enterica subsp. enterica]